MVDAFYDFDGERFVPTDWTRGPWDPNAQHAGPPAALVGRALEGLDPPGMQLARLTLEVIRPIPLSPLRIDARPVRTGRRVQFVQASISSAEGEVARAAAWRIRTSDGSNPEANLESLDRSGLPRPDELEPEAAYDPWSGSSYFRAMEWRFARGGLFEPGPAACWMRMRVALVSGERPSPLTRALAAADSGNGISSEVPWGEYLFINTELTVHLARMPGGEWVCLDAVTRMGPDGVGMAQSILWDERGRFGSGNQTLLITPR